MEQYSQRARSDRYGSKINRAPNPFLVHSIPYISVMIGSILPFILLADIAPLVPPIGFLILIGWRIVRPGVLPLWAGFPLGAFDDLYSGQPFGSAILLWSLTMIALEILENRFPWHGFWQDWSIAALVTLAYAAAMLLISGASTNGAMAAVMAPQIIIGVLIYPFVARLIALFDRLRLFRSRKVA